MPPVPAAPPRPTATTLLSTAQRLTPQRPPPQAPTLPLSPWPAVLLPPLPTSTASPPELPPTLTAASLLALPLAPTLLLDSTLAVLSSSVSPVSLLPSFKKLLDHREERVKRLSKGLGLLLVRVLVFAVYISPLADNLHVTSSLCYDTH